MNSKEDHDPHLSDERKDRGPSQNRSGDDLYDDSRERDSSRGFRPFSPRNYLPHDRVGPPRNMDEMSALIYTLKDDLFDLRRKQEGDSRPFRGRHSSSYSRSRSRDRDQYRYCTRSRSRSRRPRYHGARRSTSRDRYRSRSGSPSRHRGRSHSSRLRSRAPTRSRDRSVTPLKRSAVDRHSISPSNCSGAHSDGEPEHTPHEGDKTGVPQGGPKDDPKNPFCGFVKQIAADTKIGDPIDPWLAQFMEKSMSSPPSKDVLQEICDKYKRPENVNNLQVPAVEHAVWIANSSKARGKDNLRQKHQETFIKMMIALTSATDELNKKYIALQKEEQCASDWLLGPLGKLKDAIVVGGFHNMQDITKRRRYDLEFYMPDKYRRLCTDFTSFPPTPTALLGENIDDAVKQMDLTNKLTQKLDKNSSLNAGGAKPPHSSNQGNKSYPHKKGKGFKNNRGGRGGRGSDDRPSGHTSGRDSSHYDKPKKPDSVFRRGGPHKNN